MWQLSPSKGGIPPHIPPKCLRSEILALEDLIVVNLPLLEPAPVAPPIDWMKIWVWNRAQDVAR